MAKIIAAPVTMRPAARAQQQTKTVSAEAATDTGWLEQQSDEELIRVGVLMMRQRDAHQTALDAVLTVLDGRFDQLAVSESIIKEHGIADRKVTNTWLVNAQHLEELRAKLGKEFSQWIEEGEEVSVVADRVQELRDMLGKDYHEFFHSEPVAKLRRTAQKLVQTSTSPSAQPKIIPAYRKFFSVETKSRVAIRPVERP